MGDVRKLLWGSKIIINHKFPVDFVLVPTVKNKSK